MGIRPKSWGTGSRPEKQHNPWHSLHHPGSFTTVFSLIIQKDSGPSLALLWNHASGGPQPAGLLSQLNSQLSPRRALRQEPFPVRGLPRERRHSKSTAAQPRCPQTAGLFSNTWGCGQKVWETGSCCFRVIITISYPHIVYTSGPQTQVLRPQCFLFKRKLSCLSYILSRERRLRWLSGEILRHSLSNVSPHQDYWRAC